MQLSDLPFLLLFLPCVIAVYGVLRNNVRLATGWLLVASAAYYCSFGFKPPLILAASILFNFLLAPRVAHCRGLLTLGIAVNVAFLAVFKYWLPPVPPGMSFFTFTQIAYLLEARDGDLPERDGLRYAFMLSFFPKILAGPIVRPSEFLTQPGNPGGLEGVTEGLALFVLGFAKKLAANAVGVWSAPAFLAAQTRTLSLSEAWVGVLAFTLQIYFDFSGYSDMAVGIARCFGYKLPLNFNSPYMAASAIEFWKRWHISFTRFLADNVFFKLPGNRNAVRRHINLMITMMLCGIWHGSNWTFAAWGALHGAFLVVNHLWRSIRQRYCWTHRAPATARIVTLLAVVAGWVLFGSRSLTGATHIFNGLLGQDGLGSTPALESCLAIAALGILACVGPNSQEIVVNNRECLVRFAVRVSSAERSWLVPGAVILWICGILFWVSQSSGSTPFIYAIF